MEWVSAVAKYMEVDTPTQALPTLGDGVRSTFDEAYDALAWSKKQIINNHCGTNAYHSRRSHYAFEKFSMAAVSRLRYRLLRSRIFSVELVDGGQGWLLINRASKIHGLHCF